MPDEETNKRKDIDMSSYKENVEFVKKFLEDDDWHYEMIDHEKSRACP